MSDVVTIVLPLDSDEDRSTLRGALLAARATELAELRRRGGRLSFGYGEASQRASMSAEVANVSRRIQLLDRLIDALDGAT